MVKCLFYLITWDFSTLLLFELFYKMAAFFCIFPLFQHLFQYSIKKAGYVYLTNNNVFQVLEHPLTLLLLILLVLLFAFYVYIETTALVLYFECAVQGKKVKVFSLFLLAIKRSFLLFHPKNLLLVLFLLVFVPVSGVAFTSGPLSIVQIPEFIMEFISQNWILHLLWLILLLIIGIVVFRWVFSIHELTIQGGTFRKSCEISKNLLKKRYGKTFLFFMKWSIVLIIFAIVLFLISVLFLLFQVKVLEGAKESSEFWMRFDLLNAMGTVYYNILGVVCNLALITILYYRYRFGKEVMMSKTVKEKRSFLHSFLRSALILLLFILYTVMSAKEGFFNPEDTIFAQPQVVAHRASAYSAPENTLAAMEEAVRSNADFAEIDVQQTKDGVLILMHDTSLFRTTGLKKLVEEVDYEEIKTLDAGSFFDKEFQGEPVPTLEEVLKYSKGKIRLMIELKSKGEAEELLPATIALIKKYQMEEECLIGSMDLTVLQESKRLNKTLKTVYITTLAFGKFYDLEGVDSYSVESSFVNRTIVREIQAAGKKIFAWTVNDETRMRKLKSMQVDGIITDDPYFAFYVLHTKVRHPVVEWFAKQVFDTTG